jgi:hypothetical protein
VKELGITEITSIISKVDTSYIYEIRKFDKLGQEIERISPSYDGITRHCNKYDSLGRRISFIIYNKQDTSIIQSKKTWIYIDSNHYYIKRFNANLELRQINEYSIEEEDSALWIHETETDYPRNKSTKKISKYTQYGDSLQISEFVRFDKEGKIDKITSYYDLMRIDSTANRKVFTEGTCYPVVPELDPQTMSMEEYKEFYQNIERYFKKQLNGDYLYELNDDPYTYKVYNLKNQLIQDGHGIFDMKTFEYNSEVQLIKVIGWGAPIDDHGIVETSESVYEYYENGLPKSIETINIQNKRSERYRFEYQ